MNYTDLPEKIFKTYCKCLLIGQSTLVEESVIKDFLLEASNPKEVVYFISNTEKGGKKILNLINGITKRMVSFQLNVIILNTFENSDWIYLIDHFPEKTKATDVKSYLSFLLELKELVPEEAFLDFYLHFNTVQSTMDFLDELLMKKIITQDKTDNYKIKYFETMSGANEFEEMLSEIRTISSEYIVSEKYSILFWCLVRKVLKNIDSSVPIVIKFDGSKYVDGLEDLLVELDNKKILFITEDILRGNADRLKFISYFDVSIFSRINYIPSAKLVENIFGLTKKPKISYSESYDRRLGNNKWIDKIFHTNKTETYVTNYEYEPLFSKEEISSLDGDLAIFISPLERGYMQCMK